MGFIERVVSKWYLPRFRATYGSDVGLESRAIELIVVVRHLRFGRGRSLDSLSGGFEHAVASPLTTVRSVGAGLFQPASLVAHARVRSVPPMMFVFSSNLTTVDLAVVSGPSVPPN